MENHVFQVIYWAGESFKLVFSCHVRHTNVSEKGKLEIIKGNKTFFAKKYNTKGIRSNSQMILKSFRKSYEISILYLRLIAQTLMLCYNMWTQPHSVPFYHTISMSIFVSVSNTKHDWYKLSWEYGNQDIEIFSFLSCFAFLYVVVVRTHVLHDT